MKIPLLRAGCRLTVFSLGWLLWPAGMSALTFTVTPSSVSNTYVGPVTLQIGGLSSGSTVVVQKFLDANANGVVDAPDLLLQQFSLTDGQPGMVIGGVTNLNVPGDTDGAANGQISALLNFPNGDTPQKIIGKYLFVLSSPAGRLTNVFTVTNFPYAQKITGTVISNGTNVPNAVVILFPPPRAGHGPGNPVALAAANNSGGYTIQAPAGSYMPVAFKNNYVANFGMSPVLTLGSGQTLTTNLALTNATESISGKMVDANNNAIGLPGIFVGNGSSGGFIATGGTDTNGNFTEQVTADYWKLDGEPSGILLHGYVGYNNGTNIDTTSGSVSGLVLGFPKATALFYGTVKDTNGVPLAGIDVYASDNNGEYSADGYSDANGNYAVAALGLGGSDPWYASVSSDTAPTNYIFSQGQNASLSAGQAYHYNFIAIVATNHITGNVQFNGTNVVGVQVYANTYINGQYYQAQMDTDSGGNYVLNVANGDWNVGVNCSYGGSDSLDGILGAGTYQCPNNQNVTIANNNSNNVNFTVQPCNGVQIATTSLPDGQENTYYDQWLYASSCSGNISWSLFSGSLPSGLNLDSTGELHGTPNSSGTFNFSVEANDGNGHSTNQSLSLYIAPPFQITTTSLPDGTNGVPYSQQLQASGGPTPYTWSLNGNSPFGLTLSTNGVLSGTPNYAGTNTFTVFVTDNNGTQAFSNLTLIVLAAAAPLQINTTFLPNTTNGAFYTQTLQASGGTPPYGWSLTPGSLGLPPNLALASNGVLSGTLATNGYFTFYVRVTDSTTATVDQSLSLDVVNPPLQITTGSLPNGIVGVGYTNQLAATGGNPPYSWSLASGSAALPANLTLGTNGILSGVPAAAGTNSFIVQVRDSSYSSQTKPLTLVINGQPVLGSPLWLANRFQMRLTGASNQNYTVQMSAGLNSTNWTSLFITNNTQTNSFIVTDPNATNRQRFYRVLVGP
ncbi:MAG: hypothetical protein KGJ60_02430 [Verrucomicrobiota bacterium]|nr:hypothetical protein [Verrucomicrobiota bacterium]